ncbi:hypothetical protein FA15DRAFT_315263 [Coprinopsis marcescibilis]|nr:hypothetical protein FA15DRAFT_315263 [Coprinopsis marcescibilis]
MGQNPSRPRRTFYNLLGVPSRASTSTATAEDNSANDASSPSSATPALVPANVLLPAKFDSAHHYVTSPIIRNPLAFAAIRLVTAVYALITLILALERNRRLDPEYFLFAYFTNLSFTGITAYLFAAGFQTLFYAFRWRRNGAGAGYPLQQSWPRILQALHVLLYATVVTFPIIITVFYWSVLDSSQALSTPRSAWNGITVHILNAVFTVCEILFTNSPPVPWIAMPITVLLLGSYCGLAYVVHAAAGYYPYPFLDPSSSKALLPAYVVGLAVGNCIVFVLVHFLAVLRHKIAKKYNRVLIVDEGGVVASVQGNGGEGKEKKVSEGDEEEWEEVQHPNQSRTDVDLERVRSSAEK